MLQIETTGISQPARVPRHGHGLGEWVKVPILETVTSSRRDPNTVYRIVALLAVNQDGNLIYRIGSGPNEFMVRESQLEPAFEKHRRAG
jgi:hypothetical protein